MAFVIPVRSGIFGTRGGHSVSTSATAAPVANPAAKQSAATQGLVRYVQRPQDSQTELYTYLYEKPDDGLPATNMHHVEESVSISDIRQSDETFTVARNGFQLEKLTVDPSIDWLDDDQIKAKYYPAIEALLKRVVGATRVHIFDHTLRKGNLKSEAEKEAEKQASSDKSIELEMAGQPVSRVHVDYTVKSGVERLHALLPDEAEKLQQTPFAVIQVWRPLRGPVDDSPLAMLDTSSLKSEDYSSYTLHFPGRTGYNYTVHPDNVHKHRWYYAKGIDIDEAYVFVCYDSRSGRARFTPHTGFKDPQTGSQALPRESIETRVYVFWENEQPQPYATEL